MSTQDLPIKQPHHFSLSPSPTSPSLAPTPSPLYHTHGFAYGGPPTTVSLTAEQFERLFLLHPHPGKLSETKRGDPTPLGVASFLVAHTPLAMNLLGWAGSTGDASVTALGVRSFLLRPSLIKLILLL